jgi:uncharacterized membrane protein YbhN (UPF0104 family)
LTEGAKPSPWRARFWIAVRAGLGLIGIGAVAWIVRDVGVETMRAVFMRAVGWIPLAVALEMARVAMDAISSRATLRERGDRVPVAALFGAHLVAFAVMGVAPFGRPTSEAMKASLLARWIGPAPAIALGAANQANTLLSLGIFTLISAAAAWALLGPSLFTLLLVVHFVMMGASGLGIRALVRYERFGAFLERRFPKIARHVALFVETSRETALFPVTPVSAMLIGRAFQAAHFGVLAYAVGLTPSILGTFVLEGIYLLVASLGVMIPGQLGASEGGFAAAATSIEASAAQATSIALLAHAVQYVIVLVGFVVLALWPRHREGTPPARF